MQAVEAATGITPPELIAPTFPARLEYVWRWFLSLHNKRGSNGFCIGAIGWEETHAFFQMRRERPSLFDLELLEELDLVALEDRETMPAAAYSVPSLPLDAKPHLRGKKQKPDPV